MKQWSWTDKTRRRSPHLNTNTLSSTRSLSYWILQSFSGLCLLTSLMWRLSSCLASRDRLVNSSTMVTESLLPTALDTWQTHIIKILPLRWRPELHWALHTLYHLAAARTSNLSLKSWKVTRTGRHPWKSGPDGALLTPRIVTCLWMFSSSGKKENEQRIVMHFVLLMISRTRL